MKRAVLIVALFLLLILSVFGQGGMQPGPGTPHASASSSLNTGLVGFWKLDEAAGNTRVDSAGSNTLSESAATVASGTGQIGNAAVFSEVNFLRIADNAPLSITTSMTIVAWPSVSASATIDFPGLVSKWGAGDQRSYTLRYERGATNRFIFAANPDGTSGATVLVMANTFGAPSTGTFVFVAGFVDLAGDIIGISVNNGAVDTTAYTPAGVFDGSADFEIGHLGTSTNVFFGSIDAVGIWSRRLTATEITCLYNSGAGQEPPFAACP